MDSFKKLEQNKFFLTAIKDSEPFLLSSVKRLFNNDNSAPLTAKFNSYHYYVLSVIFYLYNLITWYQQLHLSVEFLSNFNYSKKTNASRIDHLIYTIENYLIRLNSSYDRTLQLTNVVFHLGINAEHVSHNVIINNHKVAIRTKIQKAIKNIKKYLQKHDQKRHTIIHKHSYIEENFMLLKILYSGDSKLNTKKFKSMKANCLKLYLTEKKNEFSKINSGLGELLDNFLNLLLEEYEAQKLAFIKA